VSGEPVCPIHNWIKLTHSPRDDLVQWTCSRCGWMATDDYIKNMTPELMAQIKKDNDDLRRHHTEAPARRMAEKIEAQMTKSKQGVKQEEKRKGLKNIKAITDYT